MTEQARTATNGKSITGAIGVIALVLFKYKVFIITFGLSFGVYAMRYGWPWAAALIALLFIHEMGHFIFMKLFGLDPKAPVFIPFVGAFVAMDKLPDRESVSAWTALAGPLIGGLTSVACFYWGVQNQVDFLTNAAYFGILLNLLQLLPVRPLDGGFVVDTVAPWFRIPGALLLLGVAWLLDAWLLMLIGGIALFGGFRGGNDHRIKASWLEKLVIFVAYVILLGGLGFVWLNGHDLVAPLNATTLVAPAE